MEMQILSGIAYDGYFGGGSDDAGGRRDAVYSVNESGNEAYEGLIYSISRRY